MKKSLLYNIGFSCILLIILCTANFGIAQNPSEANGWAREAERRMQEMRYDDAFKSYEKAYKADSGNLEYQYGMAMANYRQQNYASALKYAENLLAAGGKEVKYYRLLGNTYDLLNNYEKGVQILQQGANQYPYNGSLYFDMGIINLERGKTELAIDNFEKGIKAEPSLPDNYYMATILFAKSNQPLWALIYGELFLNTERGTAKYDEISKLLFDTYTAFINNKGQPPETAEIMLSQNGKNAFEDAHFRIYGIMEKNGILTSLTKQGISPSVIGEVRKSFLELWQQAFAEVFPNTLYKMHKEILDAGYFPAYNRWLFSKADGNGFSQWISENQTEYMKFINWFLEHPLKLDFEAYIYRPQYVVVSTTTTPTPPQEAPEQTEKPAKKKDKKSKKP